MLGERIKKRRKELKYTQAFLAERAGISKGFLSDVENNNRNITVENLLKIANVLGCSLDYLVDVDVKPLLSNTANPIDIDLINRSMAVVQNQIEEIIEERSRLYRELNAAKVFLLLNYGKQGRTASNVIKDESDNLVSMMVKVCEFYEKCIDESIRSMMKVLGV